MQMNGSMLIHERKDRKMEPFYWILTFEGAAFLIVLALALVAGPAVLIAYYPAWWSWLLLAAGAGLAFWLVRFSLRYLAKLIRKNRRLNAYRIYEDRIEFAAYDAARLNLTEGRIPLEGVESVYASMYSAAQSYHYKKTKWRERVRQYEWLPVLYIVYRSGGSRRVLAVPFYEDHEVDRWLGALQQHGVPLQATGKLLLPLSEADQLQTLDSGAGSLPLSYDGSFRPCFDRFLHEMKSINAQQAEQGSSQGGERA
ncbi:hypothetical protein [Paenibacillus pinistramenti]|uniref:hypothetical protein n=1 Tax=Paenibacillus pinistramenti TaxID=1768003 RepID=UPI001108B508|nr:hypothetical protein [Paenibacillus pinistramenti]